MTVLVLGPAAPAPAVEPHREIELSRAMNPVDRARKAHATGSPGLVYLEFSPGDQEPWLVAAKAGYILDPQGFESPAAFLVVPTTQSFLVAARDGERREARPP